MLTHRFKERFPRKHVVLPVIHAECESQAITNVEIAREAGADGVFLINHSMPWQDLLEVYWAVRERFDDWWIGVNCLGLQSEKVFRELPAHVNGAWVDNAKIDERATIQPTADRINAARLKSKWPGLYFGGVAFKYQRSVDDLKAAATIAMNYMDVVTTSGPGTGEAASVQKIRTMKAAMGEFPLAIASGITPENIGEYLGLADCYLVATGISKSFTELDPLRTRALVDRVLSHP